VPGDDDHPLRLVGQPVSLSRTPSTMATRPPDFGEHTDEVLTEFGFAAEEIAALRRGKII
jgi:crotonobetainyl-CoA:carnitine CoA-transferase CaiB-like acyl-CoA transferase